ncbi:MAG: DUF2306 domain-containing protein [Candidatus Cohnella colombiensis]|uniref:DUF2306 domain-containing protein n=1 Tax=Candidatus Cohnella colombiensis TaxID=3121368 RepID=A0AA95EXK1_9BACL|nr:MAG: DUF2306 domain-containing protein [Cohnella sp.]
MKKWVRTIFIFLAVTLVMFIIFGYTFVQYGIFSAKQGALVSFKLKSPDFNYEPWIYVLYTHIITGCIALGIGLLQLLRKPVNSKRTALHRKLGKVYAYSILISALVNIYLSLFASGGWIAKTGFFTLDFLWIYTTFKAISFARNKQIEAHTRWMYRSYALTFAGVSLRFVLPVMMMFNEFDPAYRISAWACWLVNLIVVEWVIYRRGRTNQKHQNGTLPQPTVGIQ